MLLYISLMVEAGVELAPGQEPELFWSEAEID